MDVGGAQETVLAYGRHRDPAGVDLMIAAGAGGDRGASSWDEAAELASITVVPSLVGPIRPFRELQALAQLYRLFRRLKPEVVHTHSSKAGILGRLAAWAARVPVVMHTVHGWSFRDHQNPALARLYVGMERFVAVLTTAIVVVTPTDIDVGLGHRIGKRPQYHVVRSGVDLRTFGRISRADARRVLALPEDRFVLGTVCRLDEPKDVRTLLKAFASIVSADADDLLVIVGDGPQRHELAQLAARLGVKHRVRFVGLRRDVSDLLPAMDLFVLATKSEGMPRVLVEAAASNVPIVASEVGGISEAFPNGRAALLTPAGDATALAGAICQLRADARLRAKLCSRAALIAREFDVDVMASSLTDLYLRLTSRA